MNLLFVGLRHFSLSRRLGLGATFNIDISDSKLSSRHQVPLADFIRNSLVDLKFTDALALQRYLWTARNILERYRTKGKTVVDTWRREDGKWCEARSGVRLVDGFEAEEGRARISEECDKANSKFVQFEFSIETWPTSLTRHRFRNFQATSLQD
ncbi:hypothetical protein SCHPADRAFT_906601 [Schizopora paradoxa]|uniref:Uncharacterized protein n=1 Tax=Schizopora paradoxa TaxID=27342 RepID=A0A0H2RG33_9AGAM|nr:hypothetical protein SCHPADRAFT_906601 [Schizopora paradoxa]